MIRQATRDDMQALHRMARHFIEYGKHATFMSITDADLEASIGRLLDAGLCVFVAELNGDVVGMLVAAITSPWFAPHIRMASELAWWMEPEARGTTIAIRLVKEYESWAVKHGAQIITMSSLSNESADRVGNMLRRLGYAQGESTHLKEIPQCHSSD